MKTNLTFTLATGDAARAFPAVFAVCTRCEGRGTHVSPSIDGHGLSSEDLADEDFADAYFGGAYDVRCSECDGHRVVGVADESRMNRRQRAQFALWQRQQAAAAAEARADAITRRGECGGYC